jgi:hypothetical protein
VKYGRKLRKADATLRLMGDSRVLPANATVTLSRLQQKHRI